MSYKKINSIIVSIVVAGTALSVDLATASTFHGIITGDKTITVVAPPIANPSAGTYTSSQNVTLVANSASTTIRYTIDDKDVNCSTSTLYSSAISVNSSLTIKTVTCYPGDISSPIESYSYTINIPTGSGGSDNSPSGGGGPSSSSGGGGGSSPSTTLSAIAKQTDFNNDGRVDVLEFVSLMANWGKVGANNSADFNRDGKVDIFDFVLLMANWTK